MSEPVMISQAQAKAINELHQRIEGLIKFYITSAADSQKQVEGAGNERSKGYHEGRAQAYQLAAEFLAKAMRKYRAYEHG